MPTALPTTHVTDALQLAADGLVDLFELYPLAGGTVYFKSDNDVTWRGNLYEGLPCTLSGEEYDTTKLPTPKLQFGQEDLDLLPFKGLVHDGYLEGATLVRKRVLLEDVINNLDIKQTTYFRIKRVEEYSRTRISVTLSTYSSAVSLMIPFRQYVTPDFPYVEV